MKRTKAYIGLALISIMFLSTFAFAFSQSISFSPTQGLQQISLPDTDIVDYELSQEQEIGLLRAGRTIMKYTYSLNCFECQQEKKFLESVTTNTIFTGQLTLQEVEFDMEDSSLEIISAYGSEKLTIINETEVVDVLCQLVTSPPASCALRGV